MFCFAIFYLICRKLLQTPQLTLRTRIKANYTRSQQIKDLTKNVIVLKF